MENCFIMFKKGFVEKIPVDNSQHIFCIMLCRKDLIYIKKGLVEFHKTLVVTKLKVNDQVIQILCVHMLSV